MPRYIVACHFLGLPYGCIFKTVCKFPYEWNELVLLNLAGWLIPGLWRPGTGGGPDVLRLPGIDLKLSRRIPYHVVGSIVSEDRRHRKN